MAFFLKSCRAVCGKVDLVHGIMEQCMKWCIFMIPQKFLSRLAGRLLRVDVVWNAEDWKKLSCISLCHSQRVLFTVFYCMFHQHKTFCASCEEEQCGQ